MAGYGDFSDLIPMSSSGGTNGMGNYRIQQTVIQQVNYEYKISCTHISLFIV